ncbi:DNA-directed RNA polymerases IV and V subunit 4 [Gossypium australe]|uniref:DNA-directed RNA polymerases IV and V subunit 4 n=1 Tax=Gossypium australe TaxID=47621 RepID=A0A5B6W9J5_9ROSI|nr:DNA-directed RNA polymerases IV and V subunit 4 [Gossypium australe]
MYKVEKEKRQRMVERLMWPKNHSHWSSELNRVFTCLNYHTCLSVSEALLKLERSLPLFAELPENVKCLMDCEAASILEGIQDQMVILSSDPTIKLPESFGSGLQYAKTGSYYTNPHSVRKICVIANTCPETVDEVFALVRSLEAKRSKLTGPLKDVLDELAKLKTST